MLAGQPSIEEVLPDFNLFCSGAILVGHNSNDFDYRILTRLAGEQKLRFPAEHEDTMVLAKNCCAQFITINYLPLQNISALSMKMRTELWTIPLLRQKFL